MGFFFKKKYRFSLFLNVKVKREYEPVKLTFSRQQHTWFYN